MTGRGRQKKRYWFWFDEQTCHLKYYRSQEAYQHGVFEPLACVQVLCSNLFCRNLLCSHLLCSCCGGLVDYYHLFCRAIDLRYATITPPMAAEDLAANQFQIQYMHID